MMAFNKKKCPLYYKMRLINEAFLAKIFWNAVPCEAY